MSKAAQTQAAERAKLDDDQLAALIAAHQAASPEDKDGKQSTHVQHVVNAVRAHGYSASMARVARIMLAAPVTAKKAAPAKKGAAKRAAPAKKAAPARKTSTAAKKAAA